MDGASLFPALVPFKDTAWGSFGPSAPDAARGRAIDQMVVAELFPDIGSVPHSYGTAVNSKSHLGDLVKASWGSTAISSPSNSANTPNRANADSLMPPMQNTQD